MARINDTTNFPITAPASDDILLGTDISDTSNSAGGETVNFRVGALLGDTSTGSFINPAAWHAYNKLSVGDSNDGLIWDHSVDGGSGPFETPDFEDGYQYALLFENVRTGSGGNPQAALQVEAYSNQTTSWFSETNIAREDGSIEIHGVVVLSLPRLVRKRHGIHWIDKGSDDNYLDTFFDAGGTLRKVDKVRFDAIYDNSSANFTSGKAYLLRQREYITG